MQDELLPFLPIGNKGTAIDADRIIFSGYLRRHDILRHLPWIFHIHILRIIISFQLPVRRNPYLPPGMGIKDLFQPIWKRCIAGIRIFKKQKLPHAVQIRNHPRFLIPGNRILQRWKRNNVTMRRPFVDFKALRILLPWHQSVFLKQSVIHDLSSSIRVENICSPIVPFLGLKRKSELHFLSSGPQSRRAAGSRPFLAHASEPFRLLCVPDAPEPAGRPSERERIPFAAGRFKNRLFPGFRIRTVLPPGG